MNPIQTDYLVVGAGAMAMAFVDTLLTDTDATVVIVDRHDRPGGHWNDAYPFDSFACISPRRFTESIRGSSAREPRMRWD